ncbi:unnamed protein product [Hymenolepis diminuta]|uniref:Uncharacterized protein n=1 Tax=Hymenolepis diminuta TaxID=6216 RepID=A0A564Y1H8_HYMDI|nr:unnamed protein product [Hymenolepis diminuta]
MGCDCAKVKGRIQTVAHGKIFQFLIITLAGIEGLLVVTMLMLEIERLQSKVKGKRLVVSETPHIVSYNCTLSDYSVHR